MLIGNSWLRPPPLIFTALTLAGCSGTDIGYPRLSESSACPGLGAAAGAGNAAPADSGAVSGSGSGARSGGSGGADVGGGPTSGESGSALGGGGLETGGTMTIGGAPATTPFTWPAGYDAAASPTPADGHHNPGTSCMSSSCHGTKQPFVFGGTVYEADGVTGASNVEVGISDGVLTLTAHSAANGNIWLPSSAGTIDFSAAQIAVRNGKGELTKPATAPRGSACNAGGCHAANMRLLAP